MAFGASGSDNAAKPIFPIAGSVVIMDNTRNFTYFAQSKAQAKISPKQAKNIAKKKLSGAEVIDISNKGAVYKVRLQQKDGRVVDVYVDVVTGRVR